MQIFYDRTNALKVVSPLPEGMSRHLMVQDGPLLLRRLNDGQMIPVFSTNGGWLWTNDSEPLPINYYEIVHGWEFDARLGR